MDLLDLFGQKNHKFNLFINAFPDLQITSRGNHVKITGMKKRTQEAKSMLEQMIRILKSQKELKASTIKDMIEGSDPFEHKLITNSPGNTIVHGRGGKPIKAKTRNQKKLVESSERNDVVFAIGPAGTGKTYTAVALAVRALKNKMVKKIILTRPAVEAGESLGFLPGDLKEKVDPYLRPLYDALDDMLPLEKLNHFMANRVIEIAPLAFMRGRTLDNSFIILDEAQNATLPQIKMFLTRLGPSAKCIITGDLSQIDLPYHGHSGLQKAIKMLDHVEGIGSIHLTSEDVVRHRLVKQIIKAFDKYEARRQALGRKKKGKKEEE